MMKKIILLLSVFMLMFSLYQIVPYFYYNVKQETIENDIHKIAYSTPSQTSTTKNEENVNQVFNFDERKNRQSNFENLRNENNDFVAWIQIPNTKIDYPVLQTLNNFYLNHDFYKKKSPLGSIFMDSVNTKNDKNIVLYGHHMKSGKMFAFINKYSKKEIFNENKLIEFDTEEKLSDYEIIAAFRVKENELNEISEILLMDNNENFDRFVQFVEKRNLVDGGDGFSYEDHYLTLMTCEYTNKNGRFFVIAKRIAENK